MNSLSIILTIDPTKLKDVLLSNSGLSRKLQTVMGDYVGMEGYFMKEMMLKVIYVFVLKYVEKDFVAKFRSFSIT